MKRSALALSAGILLMALLPGSVMANVGPGVLDRSNDPNLDGLHEIGSTGTDVLAQSFIPSRTGMLTGVQLYMLGDATSVNAKIETTAAGLPNGILATSSAVTFASASGWVDYSFPAPAQVFAGNTYAIVFSTKANASAVGSGDTYSGGQSLIVDGVWKPITTWSPSSVIEDFAFRTYVAPQTTTVQWDKLHVVAGSSTPLTLTVTTLFPADAAISTYAVGLSPLPSWFNVSGVTCSSPLASGSCTVASLTSAAGVRVTGNPSGMTFTVTLVGTAAPALASAGTNGTGQAEGCMAFVVVDRSVGPAQLDGLNDCVAGLATVAVLAPGATPPPTTTGSSPTSNEPGSSIWLLPLALIVTLGGAVLVIGRQKRVRL